MQYIRHVFEFLQTTINAAGNSRLTPSDNNSGTVYPVKNHGAGRKPAANLPCQKSVDGFNGVISIERVPKDVSKRHSKTSYR
jgi:hypothetical protein